MLQQRCWWFQIESNYRLNRVEVVFFHSTMEPINLVETVRIKLTTRTLQVFIALLVHVPPKLWWLLLESNQRLRNQVEWSSAVVYTLVPLSKMWW